MKTPAAFKYPTPLRAKSESFASKLRWHEAS